MNTKRDDLLGILPAENVLAGRYFFPGCHRSEPFCSNSSSQGLVSPVTDRVVRRVILLPTGAAVDPSSIKRTGGILGFVVSRAAAVSRKIRRQALGQHSPLPLIALSTTLDNPSRNSV